MKYIFLLFLLSFNVIASERITSEQIHCIAKNIYFEARSEDYRGQLAVGFVTMNRVNDKRFPNTVCEVVYQGRYQNGIPVKYKCHFSWWCDGRPERIRNEKKYASAIRIALLLVSGSLKDDITKGSTHYHRDDILPYWASSKRRIIQIGRHIFYKWPIKSIGYKQHVVTN